MENDLQYALECIIWYDGLDDWLEELADALEKYNDYPYDCPIDPTQWRKEHHIIWMLLVGMFGNWGTSIRSGWIEDCKGCAAYIRKTIKSARGEEV